MQGLIHYSLHLVFPVLVAWFFYRKEWKFVYLLFLATMLVDLDHLLATPVFQANRCSIGFHPLHTWPAIAVYVVALAFKRPYNILALGLVFHMATDFIDCTLSYRQCAQCLNDSPLRPAMEWLFN
ncbi:MAG: hypothetical protein KDC12_13795 [Flavobacteriales bacterium]|nr:hypothetical protein [Flavobacteriales bacterium]